MSCFLKKKIYILFIFAQNNGVRKHFLFSLCIKIIFLAPPADIFAGFEQKLIVYIFFKTRHNILNNFTCTVNASWLNNV